MFKDLIYISSGSSVLIQLFLKLSQEMAFIGITAYIFSKTKIFKRLVIKRLTNVDKILMIFFFGFLSILGTYLGVEVKGALANTRAIGTMAAGLLGGPLVGFGAGLIAGGHRYLLGGFTALACGLSTMSEGLFAGWIQGKLKSDFNIFVSIGVGLLGEALQMLIILLVARPLGASIELVSIIALPMMVVNSIGLAIFMNIVKSVRDENEKIGAIQAQKALIIANRTLPYLRNGLNYQSAKQTAKIILEVSNFDALAITDKKNIIVHLGIGDDHHRHGNQILTKSTLNVVKTGDYVVANTPKEIGCSHKGCLLSSAIVVPLKIKNDIIGTIKFYSKNINNISSIQVELATGIAQLLSTQLELARLQDQAKLATVAELKALQAQINPHFLFNSLNTVVSFCRTKPEMARDLLIQLSEFFRKTLKKDNHFVYLREEIDLINCYLAIEKARFGNRIKYEQNIPEEYLDVIVPKFILQPLVENAVKHGIAPKVQGGTILVNVKPTENHHINIEVVDDGVGMITSNFENIPCKGMGIGLNNINQRLKSIFNHTYGLAITTSPSVGTKVSVNIPISYVYGERKFI